MLVALIQGVIGAFNKDFGPFDERCGEKSGKSADENFLEECGVHPFLRATIVPVIELFGRMSILYQP